MKLSPHEIIMINCARAVVGDEANTEDGVKHSYLYMGLFAERYAHIMRSLDKLENTFKEVGMADTMLVCPAEGCGAPVLLEFGHCKICNHPLIEAPAQAVKAPEQAPAAVQTALQPATKEKPAGVRKRRPAAAESPKQAEVAQTPVKQETKVDKPAPAPKVDKAAPATKVDKVAAPKIDMSLYPSPDKIQPMDFKQIKAVLAKLGSVIEAKSFGKMSELRAFANKLIADKLAQAQNPEPEIAVEEPAPESEDSIKFNDADVEREAVAETSEEEEEENFDFNVDEIEETELDVEDASEQEEEEEWE
jgi:hypothetical protein